MSVTKIITLNVGGKVFKTTWTSLQTLPHTLLAELTNPALPVDNETCARTFTWRDVDETNMLSGLVPRGGTDRYERLRPVTMNVTSEANGAGVIPNDQPYKASFQIELEGERPRSSYIHFVNKNTNKAHTLFPIRHQRENSSAKSNESSLLVNTFPTRAQIDINYLSGKSKSADIEKERHPLLEPGGSEELFFDRNSVLMPQILDAYRLGQLHLPANMCSMAIREELKFWKIPEDMISECCWKTFQEGIRSMAVVETIDTAFDDFSLFFPMTADLSLPTKVWLTMERPSFSPLAKVWTTIYFSMVVLSLLLFMMLTVTQFTKTKPEFERALEEMLDSNDSMKQEHHGFFTDSLMSIIVCELVIVFFFTVEFIVRAVCCPITAEFFRNKHNQLDLVILVVVWSKLALDEFFTLYPHSFNFYVGVIILFLDCLQAIQTLRVVHLSKHMREMKIMYLSTRASARELMLLVTIVFASSLLFGTTMYLVEVIELHDMERLTFTNIPKAAYWAIITITTIGYGDVYPTSVVGHLVAALCAIFGLLLVSLPIAIIASNFSSFYHNMTSGTQRMRRINILAQIQSILTGKENEDCINENVYRKSLLEFNRFNRGRKANILPL